MHFIKRKGYLQEDGSALVAWRDRAGPAVKLQLARIARCRGRFGISQCGGQTDDRLGQGGRCRVCHVDEPRPATGMTGESAARQHHGGDSRRGINCVVDAE